jgi:quaternary ammonium compound-resistance protein SugE
MAPGFFASSTLAWISLAAAGLFEIIWAASMKQSHGFTKLVPSVITLIGMIASVALLSFSMRTLPLGTAYTIWTGIGAVGAFAIGIFVLGEQANVLRLAAAALIVSGLILMKLATAE